MVRIIIVLIGNVFLSIPKRPAYVWDRVIPIHVPSVNQKRTPLFNPEPHLVLSS